MAAAASLLPELEDVVQNGPPERRWLTLQRITSLLLDGAESFRAEHVALFDDVLGYLTVEIEAKALAELARSIAPLPIPPLKTVNTLARHDDIDIAGPVLRQTSLPEPDLLDIAQTKGQAHLLALSTRAAITEALGDIIVQRGDRDVAHSIAVNSGAQLSEQALAALVERAEDDGVLAEKVGLRTDISPRLFRELLMKATDLVRDHLLTSAKPETQAEIRRALNKAADDVEAKAAPHNYAGALERVRLQHAQGTLAEAQIAEFADAGRYEDTIAALSVLCAVPVDVVDRLLSGERPDPVLILGRANGFSWDTVRAVFVARPTPKPVSAETIAAAKDNFDKLTVPTAQRVVRFWQVRRGTAD